MNDTPPAFSSLEVLPGFKIEFDRTARKLAGVQSTKRGNESQPLTAKKYTRLLKSIMNPGKRRLYSDLILDEAVALKRVTNLANAEKVTGVKRWSIIAHERKLKFLENGAIATKQPGYAKYTDEQKKSCVILAIKLLATGNYTKAQAFKEAGRRTGTNGASVQYLWYQGRIKDVPSHLTFQQPGKAYEVVSAYSTKVERPQAHP